MIHPDTEIKFISDEIGYGVVATKFIPKGTITWALDKLDREFTPTQVDEMEKIYKEILLKYCYRNNKGHFVLCWDISRYVNHSFKSSCVSTAYDFEIAVRDIYPGEELTDDYGYLNVEEAFEAADEGTDRKVVYPDDLLRYHNIWDAQILQLLPNILAANQPLGSLISADTWRAIKNAADGNDSLKSILTCYCAQP
jgi:hypothetical protein